MKPGRMIHGTLTGESAAPTRCGRASSLGTTRTAPGKSAPSAATRSKSLRGHPAARKRRVHLHIRHVPGRCLHQPSDSVVRSPLEQMFEFGMRGRHRRSTFRVVVFSRVRLKTLMSGARHCGASIPSVDAKHMVLPSSSEARKCLLWHVDCWDTVKDPHDHDGLAFSGPGVQMKLARLIQINAMDAALLSAVPPKALPRPSRVPLSFFALDNSQDHQTRLAFSALTPEQIQTSVTRFGRLCGECMQRHANVGVGSEGNQIKLGLGQWPPPFEEGSGPKLFNGTLEQIELGARLGAGHTRRWSTTSSIRTPRRLKPSSVPFRNAEGHSASATASVFLAEP